MLEILSPLRSLIVQDSDGDGSDDSILIMGTQMVGEKLRKSMLLIAVSLA